MEQSRLKLEVKFGLRNSKIIGLLFLPSSVIQTKKNGAVRELRIPNFHLNNKLAKEDFSFADDNI